jgi:hypothetical protein
LDGTFQSGIVTSKEMPGPFVLEEGQFFHREILFVGLAYQGKDIVFRFII